MFSDDEGKTMTTKQGHQNIRHRVIFDPGAKMASTIKNYAYAPAQEGYPHPEGIVLLVPLEFLKPDVELACVF